MLKSTAIVLALALAVLLIYAATRPDVFRVQRTASIKATADRIHPLIGNLRQFNTWNPYNRKDPNMKGLYQGPEAGPGAHFAFEGNKDVGKGSIEIVEAQSPSKVTMKLDMLEPFEGHNIVEFTLAPRGDSTEVTWAMHGPAPYMAKLMGIFFDMDKMVGRDFEAGLANLKAVVEKV
jgi:hypothetical protein